MLNLENYDILHIEVRHVIIVAIIVRSQILSKLTSYRDANPFFISTNILLELEDDVCLNSYHSCSFLHSENNTR